MAVMHQQMIETNCLGCLMKQPRPLVLIIRWSRERTSYSGRRWDMGKQRTSYSGLTQTLRF
jgi:hypothetical protein